MEFELRRNKLNDRSTRGDLFVKSFFYLKETPDKLCSTLEDEDRGLKQKYTVHDAAEICKQLKKYGITAIPRGNYKIQKGKPNRKDLKNTLKVYYLVRNLWDGNKWEERLPKIVGTLIEEGSSVFSGVYIHSGNRHPNTEGCILVGEENGNDAIQSSRASLLSVMDIIQTAIDDGYTITLDICLDREENIDSNVKTADIIRRMINSNIEKLLLGRIDQLEGEKTTLENDITGLENNIKTLKGDITTLGVDITKWEGNIKKMDDDITKWEGELNKVIKKWNNETDKSKKEKLENEKKDLQDKIDKTKELKKDKDILEYKNNEKKKKETDLQNLNNQKGKEGNAEYQNNIENFKKVENSKSEATIVNNYYALRNPPILKSLFDYKVDDYNEVKRKTADKDDVVEGVYYEKGHEIPENKTLNYIDDLFGRMINDLDIASNSQNNQDVPTV